MSKLINELKQEHQEIDKILKDLQSIGYSSKRSKELLIKSREKLIDHLKKEDDKLYPPLEAEAESNQGLNQMLETFGKEMDQITRFVEEFHKKYYTMGDMEAEGFKRDLTSYITTLKNRIMREEVAIYKEYEKLKID